MNLKLSVPLLASLSCALARSAEVAPGANCSRASRAICNMERDDPVCAEGRTYRNACLAECAGNGSWSSGECEDDPCGCFETEWPQPVCGKMNMLTHKTACWARCSGEQEWTTGACLGEDNWRHWHFCDAPPTTGEATCNDLTIDRGCRKGGSGPSRMIELGKDPGLTETDCHRLCEQKPMPDNDEYCCEFVTVSSACFAYDRTETVSDEAYYAGICRKNPPSAPTKYPSEFVATAFDGVLGYGLDEARAKCAEACEAEGACGFAELRWRDVELVTRCTLRADCDWGAPYWHQMHLYQKYTPSPTPLPTPSPTSLPTPSPTPLPTPSPSPLPTPSPSPLPSPSPTSLPTPSPSPLPSPSPTSLPTQHPTPLPSPIPTESPTPNPSASPTTAAPTQAPTPSPTERPTGTIRWRLIVRDIRKPGIPWKYKAYASYVGVWGRDPAILTWDTSANDDVVVIKSPVTGGEYCMYWSRGNAWRTTSAKTCDKTSDPSHESHGSGLGEKLPLTCMYAGCSYPGQLEFEWQPMFVVTSAPTASPMPTPTPSATPSPSQKPPTKAPNTPSSTTRPVPSALSCILLAVLLVGPWLV